VNSIVNATLTAMFSGNNVGCPTIINIPTVLTILAVLNDMIVLTIQVTGNIFRQLSFPSEIIPPQRVVAFDVETSSIFFNIDTIRNQIDYTFTFLPTGVYHVVS
jgi:hypothetical protein